MKVKIEKILYANNYMFIHLMAWAIILGIPFFFTGRESQDLTFLSYIRREVAPISFMIVFYVNYQFLIDEYLFNKHTKRFMAANIVLIMVVMFIVHCFFRLLPPPEMHMPPRRPMEEEGFMGQLAFLAYNFAMYILVIGLSVAIKMTLQWYISQREQSELNRERIEAEIQNLKSQLNPHFLFNTLNNIYSLISICPDKAQDAVHELSKLLRYVLYESSEPFVPIEKEVHFVKNYVELMRIRLPESVKLKVDINIKNNNIMIAPLLFISPIENAFKHGVSNNAKSFINIGIEQHDDKVVCLIQNSNFPEKRKADKSGSGIGLQNLQRRLSLLYDGRYTFHTSQTDEVFECCIVIEI